MLIRKPVYVFVIAFRPFLRFAVESIALILITFLNGLNLEPNLFPYYSKRKRFQTKAINVQIKHAVVVFISLVLVFSPMQWNKLILSWLIAKYYENWKPHINCRIETAKADLKKNDDDQSAVSIWFCSFSVHISLWRRRTYILCCCCFCL